MPNVGRSNWVENGAAVLATAASTALFAVLRLDLVLVNQRVGVAIALVACLLAAPDATVHYWRSRTATLKQSLARLWRGIRTLLGHREARTGSAVALAGTASLGIGTGEASLRVWSPNDPPDAKIERLYGFVQELEDNVARLRFTVRELSDSHSAAVSRLENRITDEVSGIRGLIKSIEDHSVHLNARALPVVGFGILLSGIPDDAARLGAVFPSLGIGVLAKTLLNVILEPSPGKHAPDAPSPEPR